jgi:hypothetical protein
MNTQPPTSGQEPSAEDRTLPPYEGRRETADVDGPERTVRDGAKVGGATGPVEDAEPKAPDPAETERGRVASPSEEDG